MTKQRSGFGRGGPFSHGAAIVALAVLLLPACGSSGYDGSPAGSSSPTARATDQPVNTGTPQATVTAPPATTTAVPASSTPLPAIVIEHPMRGETVHSPFH